MPLSPFYTSRPGDDQGRVDGPDGFTPPEGTAALVLGSDRPGYFRRMRVGDKFDVFQSNSPDAGEKLLKFASRTRGSSRMPAVTSNVETYALADGETLTLKIDEQPTEQTITFNTGDFSDIANATAREVRDAINAEISGGTAFVDNEGNVYILSDNEGRFSRVEITGGTANAALGFEEWAWRASLSVAGTVIKTFEILPGRTFDFDEWGANLDGVATPFEIRFSLEVIAK